MSLHNSIFVLADLCLGGPLSWRAGTCLHCCSLTLVLIVVLHNLFCYIISAAPIKKCQKLGTCITTTCQLLWWMQWNFAFINFKIFLNPTVIPPDPLAGGTININFRCCLLTHTFFNFLFAFFIVLIYASCWACVLSIKRVKGT